jgi:hypothetical protein
MVGGPLDNAVVGPKDETITLPPDPEIRFIEHPTERSGLYAQLIVKGRQVADKDGHPIYRWTGWTEGEVVRATPTAKRRGGLK